MKTLGNTGGNSDESSSVGVWCGFCLNNLRFFDWCLLVFWWLCCTAL